MTSARLIALFVPGLDCRSEIWEHAPAFLPELDVRALDWPWPERIRSYDEGATWLAGAIRSHGAHFVVAHSFAGVLALRLRGALAAEPEWRLVVVDTFVTDPQRFFRNHVWGEAPALRERVTAMLAEERPRFPMLRALATGPDPERWRGHVLAARASYIYGGRSGEHAPTRLAELAGVPESHRRDVRVVPDTSHFPMLEQPQAFYAALRASMGLGAPRTAR